MVDTTYYEPKVVLAVAPHADDLEVVCGGSVARWAANGAAIYYLILTDSSCGSDDVAMTRNQVATTRKQEQVAAANLIGVRDVFFENYCDGELEVNLELKRAIARIIRRVKPDTLITFDPTVIYDAESGTINHTDHRATGQAAIDAFFPLARDRLSLPSLWDEENLAPHKTAHLLLTNIVHQNYFVDVSDFIDVKIEAIMKHISQFGDNQEQIVGYVKQQSQKCGSKIGSNHAEGFIRIDVRL